MGFDMIMYAPVIITQRTLIYLIKKGLLHKENPRAKLQVLHFSLCLMHIFYCKELGVKRCGAETCGEGHVCVCRPGVGRPRLCVDAN